MLFLGPYWPDPAATGAGVRTASLLGAFRRWGYGAVAFASPQRDNAAGAALRARGVATLKAEMNRRKALEALAESAEVVVFDKFPSEEMYSWACPARTLRVLDMQDSHALRLWRQERVEKEGATVAESLAASPPAGFSTLQRELAAIHRSDLTLVCSPVELALLRDRWGVPADKLVLAPFFFPPPRPAKGFAEREGFVAVGNGLHAPNVDGLLWLRREIWPLLRKQLPNATMRVYGAHLDGKPQVQRLDDPEAGFHIAGFAESLDVLADARALLAPVRFGAGIKTKVLDAFWHGTPVVTTGVGREGIGGATGTLSWGGRGDANTAAEFADAAVELHEGREMWERCALRGRAILREEFDEESNLAVVETAVRSKLDRLAEARARDFTGQMLWLDTLSSKEYMARWIELKETGDRT